MDDNCVISRDYKDIPLNTLAHYVKEGLPGAGTELQHRAKKVEVAMKFDDIKKSVGITKGVPGPFEVERALSRLAILPNPIPSADNPEPEKTVESPWKTIPVPTIDPNVWDSAEIGLVNMADLVGTDNYLIRKRVAKHIEVLGQALSSNRSYALIYDTGKQKVIIDGHHRLFALWLIGLDTAPVWIVNGE